MLSDTFRFAVLAVGRTLIAWMCRIQAVCIDPEWRPRLRPSASGEAVACRSGEPMARPTRWQDATLVVAERAVGYGPASMARRFAPRFPPHVVGLDAVGSRRHAKRAGGLYSREGQEHRARDRQERNGTGHRVGS